MATYKLIQDIEAEDHILGPLSFRQFVFALIAVFFGYMCFLVISKHVPFLLVAFAPPMLFCAFFAFPWGGDQPTETWALAKLRFWFLPRKRIWNQSGLKELVTITVPKKVERVYTDGLSQGEVKSRLQALANTIDSRGWAIKHLDAVGYVPQATGSERLIDIPNVPGGVPDSASPADDIMDTAHNPVAQQFDDMINRSTQERRQRLMEELRKPLPAQAPVSSGGGTSGGAASQWFMNHNPARAAAPSQAPQATPVVPPAAPSAQPVTAAPVAAAPDDVGLDAQLREQAAEKDIFSSNLRTLQPLGTKSASGPSQPPLSADAADGAAGNTSGPMTDSGDPAILSLSKNNDLNVATLAREAQRTKNGGAQDEVVISLH